MYSEQGHNNIEFRWSKGRNNTLNKDDAKPTTWHKGDTRRDNEHIRTRVGGDKEQRPHKIHARNKKLKKARKII